MKSLAKSPNSSLHMICVSTAGPPTNEIQLFPISLRCDQLCTLTDESVQQSYRRGNLYQPLKPNGIGLHIIRNPPPSAPPLIGQL
jgi:hypothetical protein